MHLGVNQSKCYPLPLPCLLSNLFERLGYIFDSKREERWVTDAVFTLQRWLSYARQRGITIDPKAIEETALNEYDPRERFEDDDPMGKDSPPRQAKPAHTPPTPHILITYFSFAVFQFYFKIMQNKKKFKSIRNIMAVCLQILKTIFCYEKTRKIPKTCLVPSFFVMKNIVKTKKH